MSKASTTRTIKFIAKAGTYTALIMCQDGDIYQEWEGTESDVTKVFPNFEQTKPKLNFVCMSSRVAEGVATPDSMQYFSMVRKSSLTAIRQAAFLQATLRSLRQAATTSTMVCRLLRIWWKSQVSPR